VKKRDDKRDMARAMKRYWCWQNRYECR
jgi:hypothetical protein